MDLHIAGQSPDRDERSAVDSVLGSFQAGKAESYHLPQERPDRSRRHLLLPVLHAINSRVGWISPGALNYACSRLTSLPPKLSASPISTGSSQWLRGLGPSFTCVTTLPA